MLADIMSVNSHHDQLASPNKVIICFDSSIIVFHFEASLSHGW